MAVRRASSLLIATVCAAALLGLFAASTRSFVSAPVESRALRGEGAIQGDAATAAALGLAVATLPEAAHAANQGYAVLQLG
eukprot:CAMPEP_0170595390 /NCGR_PEP_ID=MMETSP0224-20130122/14536_1 /TAXON_ID=285029 /ORGANISM="Togula jolla, Strain CCCM 725" /LENGTH=80 /DNA_ID=CAMNT_0010919567 /DNA_START=57 /DNA_END=296 /DNA_ORIENTATION=+